MKLIDFNYDLPEDLIAKSPKRPRDHSRLLVLDQKTELIKHHTFYEIVDFLRKGDILVVNESKVFPARLMGNKKTGGQAEILLEHQINENTFEAIGRNLRVGEGIEFQNSNLKCQIINKKDQIYYLEFSLSGGWLLSEIEKIGQTPLPPYILRSRLAKSEKKSDRKDYQTVYAKKVGSVAAPTAGLHFTDPLLQGIKKRGIDIEKVTLHVGLGTFAPVKTENITKHKMHREYFEVQQSTWKRILSAKKAGRRVIAVGTTSTRVLETLAQYQNFHFRQGYGRQINSKKQNDILKCKNYSTKEQIVWGSNQIIDNGSLISGFTDIFIYPGYKFKIIDGLITNFHLPKSTLLMLVSAFAGTDLIKKTYQEAIKEKYRFYSYGDAMLII